MRGLKPRRSVHRFAGPPEEHPSTRTPDPHAGETDVCVECGGQRERKFFWHPKRVSGWGWVCPSCKRTRANQRYRGEPSVRIRSRRDASKARAKARQRTTAHHKAAALKRDYGITVAAFEEMRRAQEDKCAICRKPETAERYGTPLLLSVDHDHETGQVRGLLCSKCNMALSRVEGVENWGALADAYLKRCRGTK